MGCNTQHTVHGHGDGAGLRSAAAASAVVQAPRHLRRRGALAAAGHACDGHHVPASRDTSELDDDDLGMRGIWHLNLHESQRLLAKQAVFTLRAVSSSNNATAPSSTSWRVLRGSAPCRPADRRPPPASGPAASLAQRRMLTRRRGRISAQLIPVSTVKTGCNSASGTLEAASNAGHPLASTTQAAQRRWRIAVTALESCTDRCMANTSFDAPCFAAYDVIFS